jgi:hypothetical protein
MKPEIRNAAYEQGMEDGYLLGLAGARRQQRARAEMVPGGHYLPQDATEAPRWTSAPPTVNAEAN